MPQFSTFEWPATLVQSSTVVQYRNLLCQTQICLLFLILVVIPNHQQFRGLLQTHSDQFGMAGIVYLRTNRFEVKLEGITFKAKDFGTLCTLEFLFPDGKIWARPPIVGLDIMRHPRDPSIILLLLCIGVGCVILRFRSGESLPESIRKFLTDERIRFVGFGIPEKKDLFPFEELGLTKNKVDIGYLAAKHLNNQKYRRSELGELARKVLGIKRMMGLTDASSFERHEQIKCAICQLFITSVIAMALLGGKDKKKLEDAPKKISFLKSLNSMPLLEGWFKLPKRKKDNNDNKKDNNKSQIVEKDIDSRFLTILKEATFVDDIDVKTKSKEEPLGNVFDQAKGKEGSFIDDLYDVKFIGGLFGNDLGQCKDDEGNKDDGSVDTKGKENASSDGSNKDAPSTKKPIKGILKCASSSRLEVNKPEYSPPSACKELSAFKGSLRRANSKGYNVSFK